MASLKSLPNTNGWVIFLDVDGVLLPVPQFGFGGGDLDADCVKRLEKLIEFLQAGGGKNKSTELDSTSSLSLPASFCPVTLILSSTWRTSQGMIDRLNGFMQKHSKQAPVGYPQGCSTVIPLILGGTPHSTVLATEVTYYPDNPSERRLVRDRVDEITEWIYEHMDDHPEAVGGRWLAIDDMKLDVDERMKNHFLHTTTDLGIKDEDVENAMEWISRQLPSPEEAREKASLAWRDPKIFEHKLEVQRLLVKRLETEVKERHEKEETFKKEIERLSKALRNANQENESQQRNIDQLAHRLALYDFRKKIPLLDAALLLASQKSGRPRAEIDSKINAYIQLLRQKKELERKMKANQKRNRKTPQNAVL